MEVTIPVDGDRLPGTLTLPADESRAGVVVLHGAEAGERSYFLYEHLADLLAPDGVAVLRYDRRASADGRDLPLEIQAHDALAAARLLRELIDAPVGLWGYSQGAWAATLAAATDPEAVAFTICVSCCGVTPAEQMRVGCARQLRKHGFSDHDVAELLHARTAYEGFQRGHQDRESVQAILHRAAEQPWFDHAYLPRRLSTPGTWQDIDHDPQPVLDRVACPVLAFYGETDEWMPIEESIRAWETATAQGALRDLTVVLLPGADHLPTIGGEADPEAISPDYVMTLARWVREIATRPGHPAGSV